ncbi:MAG: class I SAM-dependent methyltransferase [Brevinematales bacterium]
MAGIETFSAHVDDYENWFSKNKNLYEAEVNLLQTLMPPFTHGIEIGVGTGLFASRLGIQTGIEPSSEMAIRAKERGIHVIQGKAESIPWPDESFDLALMVTTICFVDNPIEAFKEIYRILTKEGHLLVAFVPLESYLGQKYHRNKTKSLFYREATFYTTSEIVDLFENTGFVITASLSTLIGENLSTEILPG